VWGQASIPAPLSFDDAKWIWTSEMAAKTAPVVSRTFRKVFQAPQGKIPVLVHTVSTADNGHKLYVNGNLIAQTDDLHRPQGACALLSPGSNVFALVGSSTGGPAAVLAKFRITYSDGTTSTVVTDPSWKASVTVEKVFTTLAFDDRNWGTAYDVGDYGVGPWRKLHPAQAMPQCPQLKLGKSSG
jgi:hypothetical protein